MDSTEVELRFSLHFRAIQGFLYKNARVSQSSSDLPTKANVEIAHLYKAELLFSFQGLIVFM